MRASLHALNGFADRLGDTARPFGDLGVEIRDVTCDSRAAGPGSLMVCVTGTEADGHAFAGDAIDRGASALVVEREIPECDRVPGYRVPDARRALAVIADRFFGHPSRRLDVFGVTGTNGKTTCVSFAAAIGRRAGLEPGVIGTLGVGHAGVLRSGANTTPGADRFQATLAEMADAGARAVMVEVSSHALDMHRTTGTAFRVVALTNLARDHLDWHLSPDAYRDAKAGLFRTASWDLDPKGPPARGALAIVPAGEIGDWFAHETDLPVTRYGEEEGDWRLEAIALDPRGGRARLQGPGGERFDLSIALPGRFNIRNAAVAAIACHVLGASREAIEAGLRDVVRVEGRMELIERGQPFVVLVDYAHTPDALAAMLEAARELTRDRLLVVVGAGGNRDRGKRPEMARAVARAADVVVLTSDNPRDEDPESILDDLENALAGDPIERHRDVSRESAIQLAIALARSGDTVVIAGKGHETTQEIAGRRVPMDDRVLAARALRALGHRAPEAG